MDLMGCTITDTVFTVTVYFHRMKAKVKAKLVFDHCQRTSVYERFAHISKFFVIVALIRKLQVQMHPKNLK